MDRDNTKFPKHAITERQEVTAIPDKVLFLFNLYWQFSYYTYAQFLLAYPTSVTLVI